MERYIYKQNSIEKPYRVIVTHKRRRYQGGCHETLEGAIKARNEILKKIGKCIDPDIKAKMKTILEDLENQVEQFTIDFNEYLSIEKVNTCRSIQRSIRQLTKM